MTQSVARWKDTAFFSEAGDERLTLKRSSSKIFFIIGDHLESGLCCRIHWDEWQARGDVTVISSRSQAEPGIEMRVVCKEYGDEGKLREEIHGGGFQPTENPNHTNRIKRVWVDRRIGDHRVSPGSEVGSC